MYDATHNAKEARWKITEVRAGGHAHEHRRPDRHRQRRGSALGVQDRGCLNLPWSRQFDVVVRTRSGRKRNRAYRIHPWRRRFFLCGKTEGAYNSRICLRCLCGLPRLQHTNQLRYQPFQRAKPKCRRIQPLLTRKFSASHSNRRSILCRVVRQSTSPPTGPKRVRTRPSPRGI